MNGYGGINQTLATLRDDHWITRGRATVKELSDCRTCRGWKARPMNQQMGLLKEETPTPTKPAFTYTGTDLFGPNAVKQTRGEEGLRDGWLSLLA